MPQDAHRHPWVDVEGGQERGSGVSGVVDANPRAIRLAGLLLSSLAVFKRGDVQAEQWKRCMRRGALVSNGGGTEGRPPYAPPAAPSLPTGRARADPCFLGPWGLAYDHPP